MCVCGVSSMADVVGSTDTAEGAVDLERSSRSRQDRHFITRTSQCRGYDKSAIRSTEYSSTHLNRRNSV